MDVRLVRDLSKIGHLASPVVLLIGSFDGLHLGHQQLLQWAVRERGRGGSLLVLSFYPHPAVALGRAPEILQIMTIRQKLNLFSAYGVKALCLVRFSADLAMQSAEQFLERVVIGSLGADIVVAGADAALGRGREGDCSFIDAFLKRRGRRLRIVDFCTMDGIKISSRSVRERIAAGDLDAAERMLGRPYTLEGRVVSGERRGRLLGFPTANLGHLRQVIPVQGVYASRARLDGRVYEALSNIGVRPTFGGGSPSVETHLLGYQGGEFYGRRIEVTLLERLRAELRFRNQDELIAQIRLDIEEARQAIIRREA